MAYTPYPTPYGGFGGYNPQNTYMPQPAVPQPLMQSGISCRLVASREEAATTQVPFDGNPYIFPNMAAGEIYVKQFKSPQLLKKAAERLVVHEVKIRGAKCPETVDPTGFFASGIETVLVRWWRRRGFEVCAHRFRTMPSDA